MENRGLRYRPGWSYHKMYNHRAYSEGHVRQKHKTTEGDFSQHYRHIFCRQKSFISWKFNDVAWYFTAAGGYSIKLLFFALCLLVYYLFVVFAEEEYLAVQFGEKYSLYSSETPALIPNLGRWTPPDRPFSWRMVLRREHDSIFSMVTGIVFVFHCTDIRAHSGQFMLRREWAIPWLAIACIWLAIKTLKKRTHLLACSR